ncbi:MAG: tRNA lysidine(34) synthetase TilS [Rhodobacterales bacterium]|nr:MAG: tRNA lysidine(34) synthetase TilS [Rhodobacterales bacterium]
MDALWPDIPPRKLGVAVSGGGDSVALLKLLHSWAPTRGALLHVATVDHGLRAEAAEEAAFVADLSRDLGVRHDTLRWAWDGNGNLQAAARAGRYAALSQWAARLDLDSVALGHTADDVAETFLLRLARGSGVDGLARMRASFAGEDPGGDARFVRPLLGLGRGALRSYLDRIGLQWIDDPSNEDTRFDRVRARRALPLLAELGLDVDRLNDTAHRMEEARDALNWAAAQLADRAVTQQAGDLRIDLAPLATAPRELRLRLLSSALRWISGAPYRPRLSRLAALWEAVQGGEARQLHGCQLTPGDGGLCLSRDPAALRDLRAEPGALWDGRWQVIGPDIPGTHIAALGEGLGRVPGWRDTGLPRVSLVASPAVWWEDRLIAAPLAGMAAGYTAHLSPMRDNFRQFLLSH